MKIRFIGIIAFLLGVSLIFSQPLSAKSNDIQVIINNEKLSTDQAPIVLKGRTFVPLRAIFEGLGAQISWNPKAQTVLATRGNTNLQLQIGKTQASVNGKIIKLDVPPQTINGRTMVPARFVSEILGAKVQWDTKKNIVTIVDETTNIPPGANNNKAPTSISKEAIKKVIGQVYKKAESDLDRETKAAVSSIQKAPRYEVLQHLINLHIENNPSWTKEWVEYFTIYYLSDHLDDFVKLSLDKVTSEETDIVINILLAMMDTEESIKHLMEIASKHPNSSIRYNIMYHINNSSSKNSLNLLLDYFPNESDTTVLNNGSFTLLNLANTDRSMMEKVFHAALKSENIKSAVKSVYGLYKSPIYNKINIHNAWNEFLKEKASSGEPQEQELAYYLDPATAP